MNFTRLHQADVEQADTLLDAKTNLAGAGSRLVRV